MHMEHTRQESNGAQGFCLLPWPREPLPPEKGAMEKKSTHCQPVTKRSRTHPAGSLGAQCCGEGRRGGEAERLLLQVPLPQVSLLPFLEALRGTSRLQCYLPSSNISAKLPGTPRAWAPQRDGLRQTFFILIVMHLL